MKKIYLSLFFYLTFSYLNALEFKLEKIVGDLNKPWSLSFIDNKNIIFTEKSGKLYTLNLKNKKKSEIKHNLSVLEVGQELMMVEDINSVAREITVERGRLGTTAAIHLTGTDIILKPKYP